MGLEILNEFQSIRPIRISPTTRTFSHCTEQSDLEITKELNEKQDQECHTPTSPTQTLRTPLVCPPPPKKTRVGVARSTNLVAPSQGFFQVPHDLASVFVLEAKSSTFPRKAEEALC